MCGSLSEAKITMGARRPALPAGTGLQTLRGPGGPRAEGALSPGTARPCADGWLVVRTRRETHPDHDESIRMIHTALDAGVNIVDTADVYSLGESEEIVGKALKGRRDDVVLATKFSFPWGSDPDRRGGSRRWIVRAVEDSLRRLGTDHIDLYQMHRPDPATDVDESLSALSDLVRAGKVRAIGSSVFPAEQIVEAQWTAERRGHQRFRAEQPPYSILLRGIESAVLPTARRHGMGVLTYGPLSSGWLSGRADPTSDSRRAALGSRMFDLTVPANRVK